jgi:hypothetical protein
MLWTHSHVLAVVVASATGCSGCTGQDSTVACERIEVVCALLLILSLARLMLKRLKKSWYRLCMGDDSHPFQEAQEPLAVHHGDTLPFSAHRHGRLPANLF